MSDTAKKPPRLLCVFYSTHEYREDGLGEMLAYSLSTTEMGDVPFALVGPSRNDVWTRVWIDALNPSRGVRVSGGCFSGSLAETETYGLADEECDDEDDDTRQEDIIALIKEAAAWVMQVSKKAD